MTTRTMRLASGFLDSLSASETVARRSRTDRGDRVFNLYVLVSWLGTTKVCSYSFTFH